MMHLKLFEKQKQAKPKISSWKETISVRLEINDMETKRTRQKISETNSQVIKMINKIDKPLPN
jgi:chaperonin cofactor prefoldin